MKKLLTLSLISLLWSCSSSDDDLPPTPFEVSTQTSKSTLALNEIVTITITSNENMTKVEASADDFETIQSEQSSNLGTSISFQFNFESFKEYTIKIRAYNDLDQVISKSSTVTVTRLSALKISGFKVLSFSNINGTWDAEYPNTDPNHLADVLVGFSKTTLNTNFANNTPWYDSVIKENQGDLTWDLSAEELYINPDYTLRFSLFDQDDTFLSDLLLGPPFDREIKFSDYVATKPTTISFVDASIDLEVELTVEWP